MAKKKKKEKKKKVEEVKEIEEIQDYSLDDALHSTKSTETTLQSLMREVTEGDRLVKSKKEEREKIRPHLSYESRSEIAEAYALEDVPLTQRKPSEKRKKIVSEPEPKEIIKSTEPTKKESIVFPRPKIQIEASTVPSPGEEKPVVVDQDLGPTPPQKETHVKKKDNIYIKLAEFFEELLKGYNERYERWENSISNILAILRKMRKITKKNTEDLVVSIGNVYKKIHAELDQFKIKRDEVEKVANVDIESMSSEFKRVLGLLELQIKEYQLKRETDDLVHHLKFLS
ncbi:MAG: hypothetical protein ACFFEN_09530 [Candidatus Thorarchaeota archaeon]